MLNSLPKSYSVFVDTMKHARESLTLDDVQKTLKTKEAYVNNEDESIKNGDNLNIKGRSLKKEMHSKNRSIFASRTNKGKNIRLKLHWLMKVMKVRKCYALICFRITTVRLLTVVVPFI